MPTPTPEAIENYRALIALFRSGFNTSVVPLVAQIRMGFCPMEATPSETITLDMFAQLCDDHKGQEYLLKNDEEGYNIWRGWRDGYYQFQSHLKRLVPSWQEILRATTIYSAHIGDIKREEGDEFTLRLHGVGIMLTTMSAACLLNPDKRIAAWKVYRIVDDSDDSVGMHGEAWVETTIPLTYHFDNAAIEATALVVKDALEAFCQNRAEAAFEAELNESEPAIEKALAEAYSHQ